MYVFSKLPTRKIDNNLVFFIYKIINFIRNERRIKSNFCGVLKEYFVNRIDENDIVFIRIQLLHVVIFYAMNIIPTKCEN